MLPPTVSLGVTYDRVPGATRSWRRRIAFVAVALLLLAIAVYYFASVNGAYVLRIVRIQVRGRLVDAATGKPVAGVSIVPLRSFTTSSRSYATTWKERLERKHDGASIPCGGAVTGPDGAFSFLSSAQWCTFESAWSSGSGYKSPPTYFGVRGLLLGRPGREDVVVETGGASWRAEPAEGGASASLEMGDVRIED